MLKGVGCRLHRRAVRSSAQPLGGSMATPLSEPEIEVERLSALARYRILDTEPEREFDDLTALAARICGTPIALMSLVDADRQWFKARFGLEALETPRAVSFCSRAIRRDGLFVVPDAMVDPRFATNPLVTANPRIRFYAGTPLITPDGWAIGTLCVIDRVPRELTVAQAEALESLGCQAVALLQYRLRAAGRRPSWADDRDVPITL